MIISHFGVQGMRVDKLLLLICLLYAGAAQGQSADADDIRQGHRLTSDLCSICHLATPDQAARPIRRPPAPSFAVIFRRKGITAEWLTDFLKNTHRGIDKPSGMPNPDLADYQIKQIVAYLMSVRRQ